MLKDMTAAIGSAAAPIVSICCTVARHRGGVHISSRREIDDDSGRRRCANRFPQDGPQMSR
jgi:hypothetical protein